MKVLFVYRSDFSSQPIGLMTLSAYLKQHGHSCDFLDLRFEKYPLPKVRKIAPDMVAYSVVSFNWMHYLHFNQKLKKHFNFFAVFGGPHCSVHPDFIQQDSVDAICIGEGEQALLELVEALENGKDHCHIPNLWVKHEGQIIKNDIRDLEEDLDTIPFLDQELIRKYHFFRNIGSYYIMTSRGCPFNCPYCINHFYRNLYRDKGKYIRRRSVENVIEELLILKTTYKAKLIIFNDDIFTLDENWLKAFAPVYVSKIGLPFDAYIRVDVISEEVVDILKDMGCSTVYLGIESGNEHIRFNILKRKMSNETIVAVSRMFKDRGIKTMSFNMLGLPEETLENAFETLSLNLQSRITYPMCFTFQPFPGIDLTQYAISKGFYDGTELNFNKSLIRGKVMVASQTMKRIERLQSLFIIGVRIPATIPLIRFLTKLPLNPLYGILLGISRFHILVFDLFRPSVRPFLAYQFKAPFYWLLPFLIRK